MNLPKWKWPWVGDIYFSQKFNTNRRIHTYNHVKNIKHFTMKIQHRSIYTFKNRIDPFTYNTWMFLVNSKQWNEQRNKRDRRYESFFLFGRKDDESFFHSLFCSCHLFMKWNGKHMLWFNSGKFENPHPNSRSSKFMHYLFYIKPFGLGFFNIN